MHHDWPLRKAIVNLPIGMKGNSQHTSINSLSLWGPQKKEHNVALQMSLIEDKLHLQYRLVPYLFRSFN